MCNSPLRALTGDQRKRPRRKTLKGTQRALGPPRGPCPCHTPEARKSALLILLSLIRATSLPGSAPQAPGHAVARDHALLPSRDGRFVARARRACLRASARKAWQRLASLQLRLSPSAARREQRVAIPQPPAR